MLNSVMFKVKPARHLLRKKRHQILSSNLKRKLYPFKWRCRALRVWRQRWGAAYHHQHPIKKENFTRNGTPFKNNMLREAVYTHDYLKNKFREYPT